MRVDCREPWYSEAGYPYRVWDVRTGKRVEKCYLADEESGYYEAYETDGSGKILTNGGEVRVRKVKAPVRILPKDQPLYFL